MMNTANRFTVHTERSCYSTREIGADTLVDLVIEAADYGDGTLALLWDGDISHYCSTTCLRVGLGELSPLNLWLIAIKERGHDRAGDWLMESNFARLDWGHSDRNLWCDECGDQIDDHFGECVLCDDEIVIYSHTSRDDLPALLTYSNDDGDKNRFTAVCDECYTANAILTDDDDTDPDMVERLAAALAVDGQIPGFHLDAEAIGQELLTNDDLWHPVRTSLRVIAIRQSGQLDWVTELGDAADPTVGLRDLLDATYPNGRGDYWKQCSANYFLVKLNEALGLTS
jgi:hypothetical protein